MEVWDIYEDAIKEYDQKNFDVALKLLNEIKQREPRYRKTYLLESYIWHDQGNLVKEFKALATLMPLLSPVTPELRDLAFHSFTLFATVCRLLALPEISMMFSLLSSKVSANAVDSCSVISNALFQASAAENFSREDFETLYNEYKKYLTDIKPFEKKIYAHKKIRVGFLSADFNYHSVICWSFDLLTRLNKNFFETYFYSSLANPDNITEYLRSTAHAWRDIEKLTDEEAAKLIRDDEIDILFDLSGHTADNRLRTAAYRPATVQISGIGYMNSTGLDCFDYFLSDVYCAGDESWFVEKLIKMSHSHICFAPPSAPKISVTPCLRKGYVTFGCFNNFSKITDKMLSVWKKILDRVPDSRLLLKYKIFDSDDGKKFVGERLQNLGFDVSRVDMSGYSLDYLKMYNEMDIALDTFPYTGGLTTCDAFLMGVPVVSLYGDRHGTRFGLSMLTNVGLPELAVDNVDEYISRAVMLANDWELLTLLRRNLRDMLKNSPLMDGKNYVCELEKVFAQILLDKQESYLNDF